MVYLHFPSNLTEEEIMLQAKYQKLKRKKKALLKQKAPRPEPERSPVKVSKGPKMEARDAREVAKKLLKSGAISPIVKTPKRPEHEGFKRPARFRGLDRKPTEEKAVSSYQPFSASPADEPEEVIKPSSITPKIKHLYDNFISEKTLERNNGSEKHDLDRGDKPKQGNTIFVSGYKVNEELLRKTFSTYGTIVDISMETGKERGFVTFKKPESAEAAIKGVDNQMVGNSHLKVSMARRQVVNPSIEAPSGDWCYVATTLNQKGSYSDKRDLVYYDDLFST